MTTPGALARQNIDQLLKAADWHGCDYSQANIYAATGVAIREFPLTEGHGHADYLLYIEGKAVSIIEAKREGVTLTGVERQSARYSRGLPVTLLAWARPLPFSYESTGLETHFTYGLDPEPRARNVFAFHRPDTLAAWLEPLKNRVSDAELPEGRSATFLSRLRRMPPLITEWGDHKPWPAQITAVENLEKSLAMNEPRAFIRMATVAGKTFTAISFIYRVIKYAGARRVLFLVDRANIGRQTKKEFDLYVSPVPNYKFGEDYIVQHLTGNQLDKIARVCIIQRMFSMLKGRELPKECDKTPPEAIKPPLGEQSQIDYKATIFVERSIAH